MPRPRRPHPRPYPRRHPWGRAYGYGYRYPVFGYPALEAQDDCDAICAVQNRNDPFGHAACMQRCVSDPGYHLSGFGQGEGLAQYLVPAVVGIGAGVVGYFLGTALKKKG